MAIQDTGSREHALQRGRSLLDGGGIDSMPEALMDPDWLPGGTAWPVLDALRDEHHRHIAQVRQAAGERGALVGKYAQEDAAESEAFTAGFETGSAAKEVVKTPAAERETALNTAARRVHAAHDAFALWIVETIERLEAEAPSWLGDLRGELDDAEANRVEAQRLLAEATAIEVHVKRREEWVQRVGGTHQKRSRVAIPRKRWEAWSVIAATFTPRPDPTDTDAHGDLAPVLVDPPNVPAWDADRWAARLAFEREQHAKQPQTMDEAALRAFAEAGVTPADSAEEAFPGAAARRRDLLERKRRLAEGE